MDDVLDWIGQQLLRAEQTPIAHAATTRSQSRVRLLARRHTRISVAVAIVTLIVAFAAIADAAGVLTLPAFWQHEPNVPSPEGTASSIPTDLASSFAILRQPPRPTIDTLPADGVAAITTSGGIGGHYGANPALSRYVGAIDGTAFWLVPGNLGSCLYMSNAGTSCTSNENMEASGTQAGLIPDAGGGAVTFLGIVPDNATVTAANTDGSVAPALRSGNAYVVTGDTNLHSVTVHEGNGHDYTNYVPAFRPPGNGPSAHSIGPTQPG
jgi:hypothetical protein